jgi:hypothetical protein
VVVLKVSPNLLRRFQGKETSHTLVTPPQSEHGRQSTKPSRIVVLKISSEKLMTFNREGKEASHTLVTPPQTEHGILSTKPSRIVVLKLSSEKLMRFNGEGKSDSK